MTETKHLTDRSATGHRQADEPDRDTSMLLRSTTMTKRTVLGRGPDTSTDLRSFLTLIAALVVFALLAVAGASAASAADGRGGDGRGELQALYRHAVGRAADASGLVAFGSMVDRDCRQGVLTGSFSIFTSPEADRFLNSADRKTNSLYAGLLDRAADIDGWNAHHRSLLNGRAWNKVVTSVLASPEYQARLNMICGRAPQPSTTSMLLGAANTARVNEFMRHAAPPAFSCGAINIATAVTGKITIDGVPIGKAAAAAAKATAKFSGANTQCGQAARYFAAAAYGEYLGSRGEAVYYRSVHRLNGCTLFEHFEVGSSPTDNRTFEGTVKLAGPACIAAHL